MLQKKIQKQIVANGVEIAKLNAESERQEEIEADATRSFEERTRAIIKSAKLQKEASDLFLKQKELEVEAEETKLKGFEKGTESYRAQVKAMTEIQIEFIEAQKEADVKALALSRTLNQLKQDELEKNLDILIDGFDNIKTLNEKVIADERKRFREREEMLARTIKLQKKVLGEEVEEIQKATKKQIDIRKLIEIQDSKELNEKIRSYGLSEILEGRLLEVVREARTQEMELNEAVILF